ncbi:MFS transporter [Saccharomonospora marina]|uniref:MFS transporter n=1 Tax=Saccharomonospora marina TaxID=632569 RepID=UPI000A2F2771|nr:MFS transporter [Saccharomonospora marina]
MPTNNLDASTGRPRTRSSWAPVVALAFAMLVVTSEFSIAAVALPAIGAELGAAPSVAAWVLLAYALPMAAISIPAGRWVDRADPALVITMSMVGVAVSSVLAALAPAMWVLLVARLLQGFAAGLTLAGYLPVISANVNPDKRGRALSVVVTIMTVGGMAGASLGGVLAGTFGWRSVFLLKLPLVVVAVWLLLRVTSKRRGGLPRPDGALLREAAVLSGAVASLLLAIDLPAKQPVLAGGFGLAAVALLLLWSRLPQSQQVVDLLRARTFGFTMAGLFLLCFNAGVMTFLLPYFLSDVLGEGPAATGTLMLVFIAALSLMSPVGGWLADRIGPLRVAAAGGAATVATTSLLLTLGPGSGLTTLGWQLALIGAGFGLFNTPIITAILASAPAEGTGTAGGVSATVRMVSQTVAPAVTALCWTVAGGGLAGFRAGVTALVLIQGLGVLALLAARRRR